MSDKLVRGRSAEILLVEDNENDVELTRLGFKRTNLDANLHHANDGVECMAFLRKEGQYTQAPTPDLILLDLNMPRMDGREVLAQLIATPQLAHLPVVILTTSAENQEILSMYRHRCSSYIIKPVDFDKFLRVVQLLGEYWFNTVALPSVERFANFKEADASSPDRLDQDI